MCLFCKIIAGEIPAKKVYEDDTVYAFMDAHPVNIGHTLICPKQHFETCATTSDAALAGAMAAVKKVGEAALKATGAQGYNVAINCGPVAGQVIMHTHVHVIPRFADDGLKHWGKRSDLSEEERTRVSDEMAKLLAA